MIFGSPKSAPKVASLDRTIHQPLEKYLTLSNSASDMISWKLSNYLTLYGKIGIEDATSLEIWLGIHDIEPRNLAGHSTSKIGGAKECTWGRGVGAIKEGHSISTWFGFAVILGKKEMYEHFETNRLRRQCLRRKLKMKRHCGGASPGATAFSITTHKSLALWPRLVCKISTNFFQMQHALQEEKVWVTTSQFLRASRTSPDRRKRFWLAGAAEKWYAFTSHTRSLGSDTRKHGEHDVRHPLRCLASEEGSTCLKLKGEKMEEGLKETDRARGRAGVYK
jgi:hypothetical protein